MDWTVIIAVCAAAAAGIMGWKLWKMKRDVYEFADALEESLDPKGVMVMIEAEHTCMTMRGIRKPGSKTVTTVTRGDFKDDFELQKMFMQMVKN